MPMPPLGQWTTTGYPSDDASPPPVGEDRKVASPDTPSTARNLVLYVWQKAQSMRTITRYSASAVSSPQSPCARGGSWVAADVDDGSCEAKVVTRRTFIDVEEE